MLRIAISLAALVLSNVPALAQGYFSSDQLPKVKAVFVLVEDGVSGGCLPSANVLKVEAELVLRRSGIAVLDTQTGNPHVLDITTNGFAIRGGCTGKLDIALWRFERLVDGTSGLVEAASVGGIVADANDKFQQHLREVVNESVSRIANEILKARR